jgi:hypothetical protein
MSFALNIYSASTKDACRFAPTERSVLLQASLPKRKVSILFQHTTL